MRRRPKMPNLTSIGMLIVFIGFIAILMGMLQNPKESRAKVAVGGFIGFIPFGFGNDKNLVWLAAIISAVFFLLWLLVSLRLAKP